MDQKKKIDARDILPQFAAMNDQERASQLVNALFHGNMSPEVKERFLEWLHGDLNKEAKEEAIQEYINRLEPNMNPGLEEAESLERLSKLTGMDGGTARAIREKVARREPDQYTRDSLAALHDELNFKDRTIRPLRAPLTKRKSFLFALGSVAAAVILLGVLLLPNLMTTSPAPMVYIEVTAAPGTTKSIELPDGSRLRLCGATTLTYAQDFTRNRKVIVNGEAYFKVATDPDNPFEVSVKGLTVTVTGTEFNVRSVENDAETTVTLVSGSVDVDADGRTTTLKPMEELVYDSDRGDVRLRVIDRKELDHLSGDNMEFHNTPLREVFRQIGNIYGVEVVIEAAFSLDRGIVATLEKGEPLEEIMEMLQIAVPYFDYEITGQSVIIRAR